MPSAERNKLISEMPVLRIDFPESTLSDKNPGLPPSLTY
jgi:hypothetical protein